MSKIAVVYWSGTGNTEAMANLVQAGAEAAGAEVFLYTSADFSADMINDFNAIAFGCPSMGDEVLEEDEFEPMFESCRGALSGKNIALFGSYGWGDGEWMRIWDENCKADGMNQVCEFVICQEEPDAEAEEACKALGKALAS